MGVDCTAIAEYDTRLAGKPYWEIVGFCQLPRCTEFFDIITRKAYCGYPDDADRMTKELLEKYELYGECWMPMADFMKLCKKHKYKCAMTKALKSKQQDRMRIVFRFDH